MKYQIGKIAALLGVTTETLRHYEKLGILIPEERTDSKFHQYDPTSVSRLLAMRRLRNAGFSLSQIAKSMNQSTLEEYENSFLSRSRQLQQEISRSQLLLQRMEEHLAFIREAKSGSLCFKVEQSPAFFCFDYREGDEFTVAPEHQEQFVRWSEEMFFASSYSPFPLCALEGQSPSIAMGLAMECRYGEALGLPLKEPVYLRPAQLCLSCILERQLQGDVMHQGLKRILCYAQAHNLRFLGDGIFVGELSFHQDGRLRPFGKLYLPVAPSGT